MSIIDEALNKLGDRHASNEAGLHTPGTLSDLKYITASKKHSLILPLLALAGTGLAVYLLLPVFSLSHGKVAPVTISSNIKPFKIAALPNTGHTIPVASAVAATSALQSASDKKVLPELAASAAASSVPVAVLPSDAASSVQAIVVNTPAEIRQQVPEWYEAGWRAVKQGKEADGLGLWEEGIRSLPADRMVIVSNSYSSPGVLLDALNRHIKLFPTIGVRQYLNGKVLYRVIVFPYGGAARQVLPKVQQLFSYAVLMNASRVQYLFNEHPQTIVASTQSASPTASYKQVISQPLPPAKSSAEPKMHVEMPDTANRIVKDTAAPVMVSAEDWEARAATIRDQLHAEDYAGVGRNAQALARDFPDRWEPWFWLGTAQLVQGHVNLAESSLERASKLNTKVAEIWVQRSIVAQERNDNTAAVSLLNKARELSPNSPKIYLNLGYSYQALGMNAEANKSYLHFMSLTEGDSSYAMQRKSLMKQMENRQ